MDNYPDGITSNDIDKHYSPDTCCYLCHWYYGGVCTVDLKAILDGLYSEKVIKTGLDREALESMIIALDNSWHISDDRCKRFLEA